MSPESGGESLDSAGEARLRALLDRIRYLEDVLEITRLVATYGPSIDSDSRRITGELWTEDGRYDLNHRMYDGRSEIEERFLGQRAPEFIPRSGHPSTPPRVWVDGDNAIVVSYQHLVRLFDDTFHVGHQNASVWKLVRTPEGWRIADRVIRETNGDGQSIELLRGALA